MHCFIRLLSSLWLKQPHAYFSKFSFLWCHKIAFFSNEVFRQTKLLFFFPFYSRNNYNLLRIVLDKCVQTALNGRMNEISIGLKTDTLSSRNSNIGENICSYNISSNTLASSGMWYPAVYSMKFTHGLSLNTGSYGILIVILSGTLNPWMILV